MSQPAPCLAHLPKDVEHHVGELEHGVALDLGECEDVVEVEHELVRGLGEGAEVVTLLGIACQCTRLNS